MEIARVHETPRVSLPYSDEQWEQIQTVGKHVDQRLKKQDVRLTMGGEPTFVSIDDMEGVEWNYTAVGPNKRRLAETLIGRLHDRFSPGGLLHFGQGKWYPGEPLPRWALNCYWRKDGSPIWNDPSLIATEGMGRADGVEEAQRFILTLADRLEVNTKHACPAYEDAWYYLWREKRLPTNVDPLKSNLSDPIERQRLAKVFQHGIDQAVGLCPAHSKERSERMGKWPVVSSARTFVPHARRFTNGPALTSRFAAMGGSARLSSCPSERPSG